MGGAPYTVHTTQMHGPPLAWGGQLGGRLSTARARPEAPLAAWVGCGWGLSRRVDRKLHAWAEPAAASGGRRPAAGRH